MVPLKLPVVLSPDEVTRMIEAAPSLFHRMILMVLYATGIRRTDASLLKVSDVDSDCSNSMPAPHEFFDHTGCAPRRLTFPVTHVLGSRSHRLSKTLL